ncbi:MAG: acyl--CoA ligase [Verrucomicrobia bacterium]|nr:acyl--CoA ligase [Verrucomicrobiota bacterium]
METSQFSQNSSGRNLEKNPILARWSEVLRRNEAKPAIFSPDGKVLRTFNDVEKEARFWASRLGFLPPRSVVSCQIGNAPEFFSFLLACWRADYCFLPFDLELARNRRDDLEKVCGVTMRLEASKSGFRLVPVNGSATSLMAADMLKVTSGSAGEPKAIRFSCAQLLADCDAICETMGIRETDINYGAIAFSHSYGFSNLVTPLLCQGVPLVAARDMLPHALRDGLAASRATVFPGVPAVFRTLGAVGPGDSRPRLCISAGAPLTPEIAAKFGDTWRTKIHTFYGASECGGICYDVSEDYVIEPGFVGQPLSGVALDLAEEGEPSQATVISKAVGKGYHPARVGESFGGQYTPGDLLEKGSDGYRICGRVSDFINVAGRKVNPSEIEQVIVSLPQVESAVIIGLPAGARGEEIAACYVGGAEIDDLRKGCARALPSWQVPRHWLKLEELPVNHRGKISRADLRRKLLAGG